MSSREAVIKQLNFKGVFIDVANFSISMPHSKVRLTKRQQKAVDDLAAKGFTIQKTTFK